MIRTGVAAAALTLFIAASCKGADAPVAVPPAERAFLFGMKGFPDAEGRFVAVTSDPRVIAKLQAELARPATERVLHIAGPISRGGGGHNLSWSWHFVPDRWDVVEISVEVCDGSPRMVENDLDYWVDKVRTFCPWSSFVAEPL